MTAFVLPDALKITIDGWLAKYPSDQRQSAIMGALLAAQQHNDGYLTDELIRACADYIGIAPIAAYEVVSFYSMYTQTPPGKYIIGVCHNISCMLCGADELIAHMERRLGIKAGQTDDKRHFTLKKLECLGACKDAPVVSINGIFHEKMDVAAFDRWLAEETEL